MENFTDRIALAACEYISLNESERSLYNGSGWAIAKVQDSEIKELKYLNEINHDFETHIKSISASKDFWFGMCSCHEFCEPRLIALDDAVGLAKILRLYEDQAQ